MDLFLTEIVREWITTKKPYKTVQFADTVLKRSSRQAPPIGRLQFKCSLCCVSSSLFDVVCFIKLKASSQIISKSIYICNKIAYYHSVPLDSVHRGLLLDNLAFALKAAMLLAEATL